MENTILNASDAILLDASDSKQYLPPYIKFSSICRICLKPLKDANSKSIIADNEYNISLCSLVTEYCKIQEPRYSDCLPQNICSECIKFLIEIHIFRSRCHRNDNMLKKVVKEQIGYVKGHQELTDVQEIEETKSIHETVNIGLIHHTLPLSQFEKLAMDIVEANQCMISQDSGESSQPNTENHSQTERVEVCNYSQPMSVTLSQVVKNYKDFYEHLDSSFSTLLNSDVTEIDFTLVDNCIQHLSNAAEQIGCNTKVANNVNGDHDYSCTDDKQYIQDNILNKLNYLKEANVDNTIQGNNQEGNFEIINLKENIEYLDELPNKRIKTECTSPIPSM